MTSEHLEDDVGTDRKCHTFEKGAISHTVLSHYPYSCHTHGVRLEAAWEQPYILNIFGIRV
jgi:hypothetical protein